MKPGEPIKVLEGKNKNRIVNKLKEQFGIENIPGTLVQRGKERIFFFSGSYDKDELYT